MRYALIVAALLFAGSASAADKVKIGQFINLNSSVCMELSDLMDIRAYALANNGDGFTAYQQKKAEGKCLAFNSQELGLYAIIDEVIPDSFFVDAILGESLFIKFHVEGMDTPVYGVIGVEEIDLSGI